MCKLENNLAFSWFDYVSKKQFIRLSPDFHTLPRSTVSPYMCILPGSGVCILLYTAVSILVNLYFFSGQFYGQIIFLLYTLRRIKCAAVFQLAEKYYPLRFTVMIQTWICINLIIKENVKSQTFPHIILTWNTCIVNHWQLN